VRPGSGDREVRAHTDDDLLAVRRDDVGLIDASESVSTRWIVASGYFARAASVTLVAVSPVSNCSSLRCGCEGSPVAAGASWLVEDVAAAAVSAAALALSVPARMPRRRGRR
jgi:hypothetical protein